MEVGVKIRTKTVDGARITTNGADGEIIKIKINGEITKIRISGE